MAERSLEELQGRRALCLMFIQAISEVDSSNTLREGALEEYNRQLASIDAQIKELTGEPPATVIGLKSATLTGRAHSAGGD